MTYGGSPDQQSQGAAPPPGFGPPIPVPGQPPYGAPHEPYGQPVPPFGQPPSYPPPYPQPYGGQVPMYGQPASQEPPHPDDPEFIAHDPHNSVIVDANGVSLEVNGHTMEFPWPAVTTIHYAPAPHGTVLMVAVAHASGMLYETRIVARRRAALQEWLEEIAPVVHYYLTYR